jgi:pimeloyl-ACP methyl ester carboxylesterase
VSVAPGHHGAAALLDGLYIHRSGRPSSPAVVFVHGGGPDGRMWRWHLERLGESFYCLAPDLPGFGRSNGLGSISLAQTADLVAELIASDVPTRRAHVVGLSYGGSVVLNLLARHADRVERAVIDGSGVLSWWGDRLVVAGAIAISPIINTRPVTAALGLVGLRELGDVLRSVSPAAFRRAFREGYTPPLSSGQLEARCPTLFVAGEKEATVRASNAAFAALMPHAAACFMPGFGHAWFAWRRELHVRMVEAWLAGAPLPQELRAEPPSPAAVDRVLRLLSEERLGTNDRPGWRPHRT